ncbi:hypothetical protein [Priestia koreensis]|nr:hypothetical protein [Priestia koreensis]MCM3002681.1 hypothetical protein [Priestia koreensis]UNL84384.1 hypothetical protein IE339_19930 [Priestia koreensis]
MKSASFFVAQKFVIFENIMEVGLFISMQGDTSNNYETLLLAGGYV